MMKIGERIRKVTLTDEQSEQLPFIGLAILPKTGIRWAASTIEAADAFLTQIENETADLHTAMQLKDSFLVMSWLNPPTTTATDLHSVRTSAKVLALSAITAAQHGDATRAAQLTTDTLQLIRTMDGTPSLVREMFNDGITTLACDACERVVNSVTLSDASLIEFQRLLAAADRRSNIREGLLSERAAYLDTTRWYRANTKNIGLQLNTQNLNSRIPSAFWGYLPAVPALDIAEGVDFFNEIVDATVKPDGTTIARLQQIESRYAVMPWYTLVSKTFVAPFSRYAILSFRAGGQLRALRVAIAAERYRLNLKQWPVNAADLVPRFIDAIPPDPIDGRPIRYAIIPEGIKTWTISDENDNRDNGGDVQRIESGSNRHKPTDFGWVILNPDLRGRDCVTETTTEELPISGPATQN
ncbi:MAG: hypothetical protein HZA51_10250 [Planctomycetes bacterium]|nr:hypothetical protein [Planctomycetota bacterium]